MEECVPCTGNLANGVGSMHCAKVNKLCITVGGKGSLVAGIPSL